LTPQDDADIKSARHAMGGQNRSFSDDMHWMELAVAEAEKAAELGETPVGAVVVCEGKLVAQAGNRRETTLDPTAHAELLALQAAARALGRWRLSGCTLYVTLEPCVMCAGALVLARVDRLVYGATDPKGGAVASLFEVPTDARLNHRVEVASGVLADRCGAMLTEFFRVRRGK
jgi:tRNA(adenine34) deaminase